MLLNYSARVALRESVTYGVPNSPEVIMADFYMMSWLSSLDPGALIKSGRHAMLRFDDFEDDIRHAEGVLLPFLKSHMLDAVFFAMCAEIRHVMGHRQPRSVSTEFIMRLSKYYGHYSSQLGMDDPRKPRDKHQFKDSNRGYQDSYAAVSRVMSKYGYSHPDVVGEFENAFDNGNWSSSYGGGPWAGIARGWLRLYGAKTRQDQFIAIDHVYDLQHNTDTVFNKLKSYYRARGGYGWIKQMLDFKANLWDMNDLIPKCSSQMKKIARPVLMLARAEPSDEPPVGEPASAATKTTAISGATKNESREALVKLMAGGKPFQPGDAYPHFKELVWGIPGEAPPIQLNTLASLLSEYAASVSQGKSQTLNNFMSDDVLGPKAQRLGKAIMKELNHATNVQLLANLGIPDSSPSSKAANHDVAFLAQFMGGPAGFSQIGGFAERVLDVLHATVDIHDDEALEMLADVVANWVLIDSKKGGSFADYVKGMELEWGDSDEDEMISVGQDLIDEINAHVAKAKGGSTKGHDSAMVKAIQDYDSAKPSSKTYIQALMMTKVMDAAEAIPGPTSYEAVTLHSAAWAVTNWMCRTDAECEDRNSECYGKLNFTEYAKDWPKLQEAPELIGVCQDIVDDLLLSCGAEPETENHDFYDEFDEDEDDNT